MVRGFVLLALWLPWAALAQDSPVGRPPTPAQPFEAGEWETTSEVVSIEGPVVTDQLREQIRTQLPTGSVKMCQGGSHGDPLQTLRHGLIAGFNVGDPSGDCQLGEIQGGAGHASLTATCAKPNVPAQTAARIEADYSPHEIDAQAFISGRRAGDSADLLQVQLHIISRRIGACPQTTS